MNTSESASDWLAPLDHAADTGFQVFADDLPQLLVRCALGMMGIITDPDAVKPAVVVDLEVEAKDLPALMVRWLSELNDVHLTQHLVFGSFEIVELAEFRLRAVARGELIDTGRHAIHAEIKAVSFPGLEIRQEQGGWRAQVIFDLRRARIQG